mgnify:CR=1 FL=1
MLRSLYIEPELQFRFAVALVILITVEGALVGQGLLGLIFMAKDWQRQNLLWDFFWSLFWILTPMVIVNTFIGLYWSRRIARPVKNLEKGLKDLREGRLPVSVEPHPGDGLAGLVQSFNETSGRLTALITRDYVLVQETIQDLEKAQSAKNGELQKILLTAQSKLSIINAHFHKGVLLANPKERNL